jgi:hypothetical protein
LTGHIRGGSLRLATMLVPAVVVTVTVAEAEPLPAGVTDVGEIEHVDNVSVVGSAQVSATAWLNPPRELTVNE